MRFGNAVGGHAEVILRPSAVRSRTRPARSLCWYIRVVACSCQVVLARGDNLEEDARKLVSSWNQEFANLSVVGRHAC